MKIFLKEIPFDLPKRTRKLCELPRSEIDKAGLELSVTKGDKQGQEPGRGLEAATQGAEELGMDSSIEYLRRV